MAIIQINERKHFWMDGILKDNLDNAKKEVTTQDWDAFIIVDGLERIGKSTMAMQIASYLDPTFSLKDVCFTINQFTERVEKAGKFQAIVFDETMGYLGSRSAMSRFNRALIKVFSEMGSKNLFVIICITSFFELDKYPAIHRSLCLLHIYRRGSFKAYNYGKKKILYISGKKFYSYQNPAPDFFGDYPKYFPLDMAAYEKKKQEGIKTFYKQKKVMEDEKNELRDETGRFLPIKAKNASISQENGILTSSDGGYTIKQEQKQKNAVQ